MSRESNLILVGILVFIVPFAGLPVSWMAWILPALGLFTLSIGYFLHGEKVARLRAAEQSLLTEESTSDSQTATSTSDVLAF